MRVIRLAITAVAIGAMSWGCTSVGGRSASPGQSPNKQKDTWAIVAKAQYRIEAGEVTEGIAMFREAVALDPTNDELREEFGLALGEAGISDEAIKIMQGATGLSPIGEANLGILLAQRAENPAELASAIPHLEKGITAIPEGQQAMLVLTQSLIRLGKGEQAWTHLETLMADRPNDPRLLLMAGQAKRMMGKTDDSLAILHKAASIPELRQRANLEIVETLSSGKRYQEAADTLGNFIKEENNVSITLLTRLATLLIRAENISKAEEVLDDALNKDPTNREALFLKASLAARNGKVSEAEQLYRRALASDPHDVDASLNLARILMDTRHLEEARKLLDDIWKVITDGKLDAGNGADDVVGDRAAVDLIDRQPEAALPWLERLKNSPLSRRSLALWIEHFRLRNAFGEGLVWLAQARVGDDPSSARMQAAANVEFLFATGDESKAKEVMAPLIAGDTEDVMTLIGALQRRKRYDDVTEMCKKAIPRLGEPNTLLFAYAAALERLGQWDAAVEELRKLIAKDPDHAPALNYLGYMFAERGVKLDEAKDLISKALKLDPTSGAYHDSMGWLYFRKNDLDRAEKHLSEAVRLEAFDATIQEHMGDLLRARGAVERAIEAYRKALGFEIEEPGQKERIEKKLAEIAAGKAP